MAQSFSVAHTPDTGLVFAASPIVLLHLLSLLAATLLGFTFFHISTVISLLILPWALLTARKQRVRWHAGLMTYLLVSVVVLSGLFAVYPGFSERLLVQAIFQ